MGAKDSASSPRDRRSPARSGTYNGSRRGLSEGVAGAGGVRQADEDEVGALFLRRLRAVLDAADVAGDDEDADELAGRGLVALQRAPAAVVVPVLRDLPGLGDV